MPRAKAKTAQQHDKAENIAVCAFINNEVATVMPKLNQLLEYSPVVASVLQLMMPRTEFAPYILLCAIMPIVCWAMGNTKLCMTSNEDVDKSDHWAKAVLWAALVAQPGSNKTAVTTAIRTAFLRLQKVRGID